MPRDPFPVCLCSEASISFFKGVKVLNRIHICSPIHILKLHTENIRNFGMPI